HADTKLVKSLPATWGEFATPEFRFPAQVMRLFTRDDFSDWRHAVHRTVQSRIAVVDDIREAIDSMLGRMGGRKIGVHVRHPSHFVEQGRVFFRDYFAAVDRILRQEPNTSIFLATDNDLAVAAFKSRYGSRLFFFPEFLRETIDE